MDFAERTTEELQEQLLQHEARLDDINELLHALFPVIDVDLGIEPTPAQLGGESRIRLLRYERITLLVDSWFISEIIRDRGMHDNQNERRYLEREIQFVQLGFGCLLAWRNILDLSLRLHPRFAVIFLNDAYCEIEDLFTKEREAYQLLFPPIRHDRARHTIRILLQILSTIIENMLQPRLIDLIQRLQLIHN